jgi:ketosteroid isomerase-like protein
MLSVQKEGKINFFQKSIAMKNSDIIETYFKTLFNGRAKHSTVREFLTDDFVFTDPLMSVNSADAYVGQLVSMGDKFELYARERRLVTGNDGVAALVEFTGADRPMTYSKWLTLRDGKIARLEVIYDPRLFLHRGEGR